jgi:hypothetical protein
MSKKHGYLLPSEHLSGSTHSSGMSNVTGGNADEQSIHIDLNPTAEKQIETEQKLAESKKREKALADENSEIKERLAEMELQKVSSTQSPNHWLALASQFRALQTKDDNGLRAEYLSSGFDKEPLWIGSQWALRDSPSDSIQYRFKTLAEKGADLAGLPNTLEAWLNKLKREKRGYKPKDWAIMYPDGGSDGGDIPCVCEASADYCERRANEPVSEPPEDLLDEARDPESAEKGKGQNAFIIDGTKVKIQFNGQELPSYDTTLGMQYLAYLINHQGHQVLNARSLYESVKQVSGQRLEISIAEMKQAGWHIAGTIPIDRESEIIKLRQLKTEIESLNKDIEKARITNSPDLNLLLADKEKIKKAIGETARNIRRGADTDADAKKIQNAVSNAIFRAIKMIEKSETGREFAAHLRQVLTPLSYPLSYKPAPPLDWHVTT